MATIRRDLSALVAGQHQPVVLDVLTPPAWTADALCAETDPEAFFPDKGGNATDAKRICAICPVRGECLEYALAYESGAMGTATSYAANGIFGGLTPRQRRTIIRDRQRTSLQEPA